MRKFADEIYGLTLGLAEAFLGDPCHRHHGVVEAGGGGGGLGFSCKTPASGTLTTLFDN
jgi:hypothetical protein